MTNIDAESGKEHDLFDFMQQLTSEMEEQYRRIQKRSTEDQGNAGDQGEENWATLLRGWLPTTYEIVTRGRIIDHKSRVSPQIDIVVLNPSYPPKLRDKKLFLAGGVVAAFECKNTLKAAHLDKAVKTAKSVKNLYRPRVGTPYRELQAPMIYGLLAHSHSWKGDKSTPGKNIDNILFDSEFSNAAHPRELLDVVCVADLGTWSRSKMILIGTTAKQPPVSCVQDVNTALVCHSYDSNSRAEQKRFTPIGSMIGSLFQKLANEDPIAESMANYYSSVGVTGSGSGPMRNWPSSVFTDETKQKILAGHLTFGGYPDEWHHAIR